MQRPHSVELVAAQTPTMRPRTPLPNLPAALNFLVSVTLSVWGGIATENSPASGVENSSRYSHTVFKSAFKMDALANTSHCGWPEIHFFKFSQTGWRGMLF